MKINMGTIIVILLGLFLLGFGIYHIVIGVYIWGIMKVLLGSGLILLCFFSKPWALKLFGHLCMVCGCVLITTGLYYIPYVYQQLSEHGEASLFTYIFGMPLFWGFIALLGGICATYHGFCNCMRKNETCTK